MALLCGGRGYTCMYMYVNMITFIGFGQNEHIMGLLALYGSSCTRNFPDIFFCFVYWLAYCSLSSKIANVIITRVM